MLGPSARSLALLLTTSMAANAADLPLKAPPPVPAPAPFSWTGFYVGANIGEAWSSNWGGTANPLPSPADTAVSPLNFSNSTKGIMGGGQIGYNWQFSQNWLLGFETDFQDAHLTGTHPIISPMPAFPTGLLSNSAATMNSQVDWFGTVRGRVGLTFDRLLVYGTGGFAYGKEEGCATSQFDPLGGPPLVAFPEQLFRQRCGAASGELENLGLNKALFTPVRLRDPILDGSFSGVQPGWTVGGGVEYALPNLLPGTEGNWSIQAEYLFVSLLGNSVPSFDVTSPIAMQYKWNNTNFHIARFGVNYNF